MTEVVQKYVVVGNGFDLNLGIKSSYGDFVEYIQQQQKLFDNRETYRHNQLFIKEYSGQGQNWSDFETLFEERVKELNRSHLSPTERLKSEYEMQGLNRNLLELEQEFYDYLNLEYQKWSRRFNETNKIVNPLYQSLFKNAQVLSFNYTSTIHDLFASELEGSQSAHSIEILQLHGNLKNRNIIFGGNFIDEKLPLTVPGSVMNDKAIRIKRDAQLHSQREKLMKEIIEDGFNQSFELYLLGHSIVGSDLVFLKPFIKKANKVYLFYYEEDFIPKFQKLYELFDANLMEKFHLVPMLDILVDSKKVLSFNQSIERDNQATLDYYLDHEDLELTRNSIEHFKKVYDFPMPIYWTDGNVEINAVFKKFMIPFDSFVFKRIKQIWVTSKEELKQFSHYIPKISSGSELKIPIVLEDISTSIDGKLLRRELRDIFKYASSITIRNCTFSYTFLKDLLAGNTCKHLVLENNKIQVVDENTLDLCKLPSLETFTCVGNRFENVRNTQFIIEANSDLASQNLRQIHISKQDNCCMDRKVYNWIQNASTIDLPYNSSNLSVEFKNANSITLYGGGETLHNLTINPEVKELKLVNLNLSNSKLSSLFDSKELPCLRSLTFENIGNEPIYDIWTNNIDVSINGEVHKFMDLVLKD
ncbi:AbiH family protein [Streptococcus suis]|uniref:AbiH family protein n=1 Tax=Streptococcus suis TaxID=1307 RepID=UPI002FC9CDAE